MERSRTRDREKQRAKNRKNVQLPAADSENLEGAILDMPLPPLTPDALPGVSAASTPTDTLSQSSSTLDNLTVNSEVGSIAVTSLDTEDRDSGESAPKEAKPTAPELPCGAQSTSQQTPPLVTLMQGLHVLKQRQAASCIQDGCVRESARARIDSMDCWSSLERARSMFGSRHLNAAQICNRQFYESSERFMCLSSLNQPEHQFASLLEEYKDSVKMVHRKRSEMMTATQSMCEAAIASLWQNETREESSRGSCLDGRSQQLTARYNVATWNSGAAPRVRRQWDEALADAASDFCVHQHNSLVTRFNLEECLHAELKEESRLRSALSLLFAHLNASGAVPELGVRVAEWTYFTAHRLLALAPHFASLMLLINHLVRQTRSIRWALPLVQIEIETTEDAQKTLAALATIIGCSRIRPDDVSEAAEATERTMKALADEWTLVEQEGQELSERDSACALSERDLLGLLNQLPVAATLRRLVLLRPHDIPGQVHFGGDASSGRAVVKSLCGAWELAEALRHGLHAHAAYRDVCDWMCRLLRVTLHCMADLCAATRSQCTDEMRHHIAEGLELLFHVTWRALEECPHREVAWSYAANLPFQVLGERGLAELYGQVASSIVSKDDLECYHRLCCVASMAESRDFGVFTVEVAYYLFQVGFSGTSSGAERGAWARALLSRLMLRHADLYVHVLSDIAKLRIGDERLSVDTWLASLQLDRWAPTSAQLDSVLAEWSSPGSLQALLPHLLPNPRRDVHRALAARIVSLARSLVDGPGSAPDWMYQSLVDLKLHAVEWQEDLNAVPSPSESVLADVSPDEGNPLVCMWTVLTTSWGHSVPLICEYGVEMLRRMASAGRHREAAYCLDLVLVVMVQSPESIRHTPGFKSLLAAILSSGPSLASRLLGRRVATGADLLRLVMRQHLLESYRTLGHGSPRALLQCWLQLLAGEEDWADVAGVMSLLEAGLECCHLHLDCSQAAREHFVDLMQRGPAKCWQIVRSPETPRVWLALLAAHHDAERASGLWCRLLWELHRQRDTRVNVDRAVERCGGASGEGLTIYRAASAVLACSVAHPVHLQLWQLLVTLYLDRPIDSQPSDFTPVGPLFFRGLFKSRLLSQLLRRLQDASGHHANCIKECRSSLERLQGAGNMATDGAELHRVKQSIQYHEIVLKRMQEYAAVLEDKAGALNSYRPAAIPTLESPDESLKRSPSESLRTIARSPQEPASPPLTTPWHRTSRDGYSELDPIERMIRRLQDLPKPLPAEKPTLQRSELLPPDTAGPRQIGSCIDTYLKRLAAHAKAFGSERTEIKTLECHMWKLLPQLYVSRQFMRQETRSCGKSCTGHVPLTVRGVEWILSPGVQHELEDASRMRCARLKAFTAPREELAKLCAALELAVRRAESAGAALSAFDSLVRHLDGTLDECPPVRDALQALTVRLGERYVSGDADRCAGLIASKTLARLASALLQPSLLPAREVPRVYGAILRRAHTDPPHVIFSYLSKFDVPRWRIESEDLMGVREDLLESIVLALCKFTTHPDSEQMVLVELLCRHMACVASGRELGRCVELVTRAAAGGTVPLVVWGHLAALVTDRAQELDVREISLHQQTASTAWWEARKRAAPACELGARAPHALLSAGVASAYNVAALQYLERNAVEPAQRGLSALHPLLGWWDAWLRPWWPEPSAPQGAPGLPWGAEDETLAADMLRAFVDDVLTIFAACKGGERDILRHMLWWVSTAQSGGDICRDDRVQGWASAMWRELLRLPWNEYEWFHLSCLPSIAQMSSNGEGSPTFCATILRSTRSWLPEELVPRELSNQLTQLLHLLTDLPFHKETLEHAGESLPWHELETEDLEPLLEYYFQSNHTVDKPAHTRDNFKLVCAAATLSGRYSHDETRTAHSNRLALVARYSRALGESLVAAEAKGQANATDAAVEGVDVVLRAVEEACRRDEEEASVQLCSLLLEPAAELLRRRPVLTALVPRWGSRVTAERAASARAALKIADPETSRTCECRLSDAKLQMHLSCMGTWAKVLQHRPDESLDSIGEKLLAGCPYEAYATALRALQLRRAEPEQAAGQLLNELSAVQLNVKKHEVALVMILDFVVRTLPVGSDLRTDANVDSGNIDNASAEPSAAQGRTTDAWANVCRLLRPWTEAPRFQLLKMITLQAADEPSENFRLWCKLALCIAIAALEVCGCADRAALSRYNAIVSEMSELARTKTSSVAAACHGWLGDKGALLESRDRLTQLALMLYPAHAAHLQADIAS